MDTSPEKDFFDLENLDESVEVEFKAAQGRDGQGELPKSFWESYAAMANTQGGIIALGIKETKTGVEMIGVPDHQKVRQDLFNQANNSEKVSCNLLSDERVVTRDLQGKKILVIDIPRADRRSRPVHLGRNPFTGTYRRNNEGDYRCPKEVVEQMISERTLETQDGAILKGFDLSDIHEESLQIYRQNFTNRQPAHILNNLSDLDFLTQLGGFGKDREQGYSGLTLAGLLMFGKLRSILDYLPHYIVDYQERPRAMKEQRWLDRVTTDFSWSGNLYDFYRIVYGKITDGLKIPFTLKGDERVEDTPVHEALREAFVNSLIHANYHSTCSLLVVKRPDLFGFRNPGTFRIPLREALHGGTSDCRNRNLQKMFQLVGLGEQSGFGFPKIHSNWAAQHWRAPDVEERVETDQVILALRMMSLMPEESVSFLQSSLGDRFNDLSELERIALVTAHAEDCVTHARLAELTKEHPRDLTHSLHTLVGDHFLESEGKGTGTFYYLPGAHPIENSGAKEIFGYKMRETPKENGESDSGHKQENSGHSPKNSGHSSTQNQEKLENPHLDQHVENLRKIAAPVAEVPRAAKEIVEATILKLCAGRFLQLVELGELLKRDPDTLRKSFINPMVKAVKLCPEHVNIKNHPKQRYTAVSKTNNTEETS